MKLKRLVALFLTVALLFVFGVAYAAPKSSDVAAKYSSTTFAPGGKAATIISKLGKKYDKTVTPGCNTNADFTYTWKNVVLKTYTSKGAAYIGEIEIKGSGIKTKAGLGVGDTKDRMIKLYGSSFSQDGNEYTYACGSRSITVTISNNKVTSIYLM